MPISVLLVDDVIEVRRLLRTALRFRGGFEVLGEAADGGEAVRMTASLHPDIVEDLSRQWHAWAERVGVVPFDVTLGIYAARGRPYKDAIG